MQSHQWGDYELTNVLGKGGMGIVYKGRQVSLDRPVAVKVLPKALTSRKDFVERFYREAKAVAKINCPQIIQVYGAGEHEGKHYFAMEFVEGEDLAEKIKRGVQFDVAKVLHVVKEVAKALAAAGEKNIIHRDIKPANIMLTRKGEIKVMDFGLAKETTEGSELTQAGIVMGTVNYLSPEQGQGLHCDQRTDIYSLGVVMYELLAGKVPYHGDNPSSVIYQHIHTPPNSLTAINPDIPKEVEAIAFKCLQKDPNLRYFSARELARDIESVETGNSPKTALMDGRTLKYTKKTGNKGLAAAIVTIVVLGGLGAGGWYLYRTYVQAGPEPGPVEVQAGGRNPAEVNPNGTTPVPTADDAAAKAAEAEHKQLERELDAIEKQVVTNLLKDLAVIEERLNILQEGHPGNTRVPILLKTVTDKMARLRKREAMIAKAEQYLAAREVDPADKVTIQLLNEYPEDLLVKDLYERVKKAKAELLSLKEQQERITRELEDARVLVELGSYDLALKKYDGILLIEPKNDPAKLGRDLCQAKLKEMITRDRDERIARELASAQDLVKIGSFDLALTKYNDVLLIEAANPDAVAGQELCTRKIQEQKAQDQKDQAAARTDTTPPVSDKPDTPRLTGAEQVALTQCTNYFNSAERYLHEKDYENALLYANKAIGIEGLDHIQAAIDLKKQAIELKTKVEMVLQEIERERKRKERVATLKQNVEIKAQAGLETEGIKMLETLREIDPVNSQAYDRRMEELYTSLDTRLSRETVTGFQERFSAGDLSGILGTIDKESAEFYKRQAEEFKVFFATFTDVKSEFTVISVNLTPDRSTCKVTGAWDISFRYPEENVTTAVTYETELFLCRKNGAWVINGATTSRKEK